MGDKTVEEAGGEYGAGQTEYSESHCSMQYRDDLVFGEGNGRTPFGDLVIRDPCLQ